MRTILACLLVVAASGCPDIKTDPGEGSGLPTVDGPTVEFDPANSILPFPNNLVLCQTGTDASGAPCTIGKVAIPAPACEAPAQMAIRTGVLNQLDGFGTYEAAMQVTFTEAVDMATLDNNIVLYQRTKGSTSIDPSTAQVVPVLLIKGSTLRFKSGACTTPAMIDAVTIVPKVPLQQKSTYTVAVLQGVKTASGKDFLPSFTWALVRQKDDPVTVDSQGNIVSDRTPLDPFGDANHNGIPDKTELLGLDLLWKAHAQGMGFLAAALNLTDPQRARVLVAWEVTTQTTTDQLDPSVAGSPANKLAGAPLLGTASVVPGGGANSQLFMEQVLIASGFASDPADAVNKCSALHCAAVGDIFGAAMPISEYQTHVPNTLAGGKDLPGPWSDPETPVAQAGFTTAPPVPSGAVGVLAFIPNTAMPAGGYPLVVFGHGLGSQKESLFVFAGQLANAGFASIAIDFVNHGDRAVRTSVDPALGCALPGTCSTAATACDPTAPGGATCNAGEVCVGYSSFARAPQCYAPFLSTDLAGTRDTIRQTVLDLQRLVLAAKGCSTTACGGFKIDPAHITYAGISLGGIIGTTTVSTAADLKAGVLNVPAVGLIDVLEHSQTLEIKCPLVDALIDAGVLMGDKWNGSDTAPTGLCVGDTWQMQPGYQQFAAVGRWVLDPADGANYVSTMLAPKKFLIQEVVDDHVVPNYATDFEGALVGQTPATADPFTPLTTTASAAITGAITSAHWLRYPTLPATDATTGNFGNLFEHASLLRPAIGTPPQPGHCVGNAATPCGSNTDCAGLGNVCVFPGVLGTARLQTDAITYLFANK